MPDERRPMTGIEATGRPLTDGLLAITFDFGNTLVPFPAGPMAEVVRVTAEEAASASGCSVDEFVRFWNEERLRQIAEDVPHGREANLDVRIVRVLARLGGAALPPEGSSWNDREIARKVRPDHVEDVLEAYADAFARLTPVPPGIGAMLERLSRRYALGLVSNWPLARAIERFIEAAGWAPRFRAVVVSEKVGAIKPWPGIFLEAARLLGVPSGRAILHVGDDIGADIAGARALGWRSAWVRLKPEDSTLPVAPSTPDAVPDLVLEGVQDIERALGVPGRPRFP
jgi:HAD superfamily hydrolase (TIGR01509 family)